MLQFGLTPAYGILSDRAAKPSNWIPTDAPTVSTPYPSFATPAHTADIPPPAHTISESTSPALAPPPPPA